MAAPKIRFSFQSPGRFCASSLGCFVLLLLLMTTATTVAGHSLLECPSKCGEVEVPYPFGLSLSCSRDESFVLTCNRTSEGTSPHRLYTADGFRVFNISILHGTLDVSLFFIRDCYGKRNGLFYQRLTDSPHIVSLAPPLSISPDRNIFVITGCDAYFYYWDNFKRNGFWTGCLAGCDSLSRVVNNTCNGFGCCESSMPKGLRTLDIVLRSYYNHSEVIGFINPCSYAFIVNRDKFAFDTTWITTDYTTEAPPILSPVVLDWSIEGANCSAKACPSANSLCFASPNGLGYLCNCSIGYSGNPYLEGGCQDINECKLDRQSYPCYGDCTNTQGSYICSCPPDTYSEDAKKFNCTPRSSGLSLPSKLIIGIGSIVLCCSLFAIILYVIFQKVRVQNTRERLFQQNGGIFLQQSIISQQQSSFKIFSMIEIENATKNFNKDFILGRGGFGTVYKGILDDGRIIAVKKSTMFDEKRNKEFAKELLVLSQVNHKNIVKLLGCCLETEAHMLVYEYIPNGTLFECIHKKTHNLCIPLGTRLKFAIESAEALRYLHTDASPPILHGDVKSSNILLDENLALKVSDFGTSIIAPKDRSQLMTFVQGTCGYLDPEYMQTSQLTDKSDVYSFGVILLELLTGKIPFDFNAPELEQNLAFIFIMKMNQEKLIDILDQDIITEEYSEQVIGVAELAVRCLCLTGKERPSVKEVVTVLERLYELKDDVHIVHDIPQHNTCVQKRSNLEVVDPITSETQTVFLFGGR